MASEPPSKNPLLNPVLLLKKEPVPEEPHVSGKGEGAIVTARLQQQRTELYRDAQEVIRAIDRTPQHGGKLHIVARMFGDSLAPSWIPRGLFDERTGCKFTAPINGGYLIEVDAEKLPVLGRHIQGATSIEARTAISRVRSISTFGEEAILRGRTVDALWDAADELQEGRGFVVWLTPFRDERARESVVQTLNRIESEGHLIPTFSGVLLPGQISDEDGLPANVNPRQTAVSRAVRRYRNNGAARTFAAIPSKDALIELIGSGSSFRIDPVRRIEVTSPGTGAQPVPPAPSLASQPIVAVVDGGLTANSYLPLEAWRAPSLIPATVADTAHGNRVASLVVHAHAWNNQLALPPLECRLGTVPAVAKAGGNAGVNPDALIDYLRQVARLYPDAKVWNLSFNQVLPEDDLFTISYLGHELNAIAREFGLLLVISVGNRRADNPTHQLCPPADCDAAIVVGGRQFDNNGKPANACNISLVGPGPEGMLKPDLSWFSTLNMLGGGAPQSGSSYAVPLVSSLAAHTFANLKDPSPDLVKALLIDRSEADAHHPSTGWGTPYQGTMPWICAPGSVTMAWKAGLTPGYAYFWDDIPIPPELIKDGKLFGKARLTAILTPKVSEAAGTNYYATRIQVALQYRKANGDYGNLLGSMKEDKAPEVDARTELAKWYPVRRHMRDFSKKSGIGYSGATFRLRAQVFSRDLYQFNITGSQRELGEQSAAFVLTFEGGDNSSIYNSTAHRMRNFVESAVINQEIEIQ